MRFLLALALLAGLGCGTVKPPYPVPPDDGTTCADLCAHGTALGCTWAEPTRNGATCIEVCRNMTEGGPLAVDLGCRARAATCAAVEACQ